MTVLTIKMIEDACEVAKKSFGQPNVIVTSKKTIQAMKDYQKWRDWLDSLAPMKRKQEITKSKIKSRRHQKHKIYETYYWE
jgi:hypothetical protein